MSWVTASKVSYGEAVMKNSLRRTTIGGDLGMEALYELWQDDEVTSDDGDGLAGPDSALTGDGPDGDVSGPAGQGTHSPSAERPRYVIVPSPGERWFGVFEVSHHTVNTGIPVTKPEVECKTEHLWKAIGIANALTYQG